MSDFKYVIVRKGEFDYPIMFPDKLIHANVAKIATTVMVPGSTIVSAGTVNYLTVPSLRHGSETLQIEKDEEREVRDFALINMFSYQHGIWSLTEDIHPDDAPEL